MGRGGGGNICVNKNGTNVAPSSLPPVVFICFVCKFLFFCFSVRLKQARSQENQEPYVNHLGQQQERISVVNGEKNEEKKSQEFFTNSTILVSSGGIIFGILTAFVYKFCFGRKKYYKDIESLRNFSYFFFIFLSTPPFFLTVHSRLLADLCVS